MLFTYGQQTPLFEQIRQKKKSVMTAHIGILEALREHNPQKAEQRMVHHIDGLMKDVATYWDYVEDQTPEKEEN
jgi:GntR family L-lactate dehydrogenase operon transcriptional regulator